MSSDRFDRLDDARPDPTGWDVAVRILNQNGWNPAPSRDHGTVFQRGECACVLSPSFYARIGPKEAVVRIIDATIRARLTYAKSIKDLQLIFDDANLMLRHVEQCT